MLDLVEHVYIGIVPVLGTFFYVQIVFWLEINMTCLLSKRICVMDSCSTFK